MTSYADLSRRLDALETAVAKLKAIYANIEAHHSSVCPRCGIEWIYHPGTCATAPGSSFYHPTEPKLFAGNPS